MNKSLVTNLLSLLVIAAGYFSPWFGSQIRMVGFFALSGAITNWLAVHMLFERVPLLYGSGVIPNHFEDFKLGIRRIIMDQFFTEENIAKFIGNALEPKAITIDVQPAIDSIDFDSAFDALTAMILESSIGSMLGMFGGAALLQGYREPFEAKLRQFIREQAEREEFLNALSRSIGGQESLRSALKEKIDVIVESRLDELTPQLVKQIVQDMIRKHLGWLVIWGGVFGGFIGLVMALLQLQ